MSLQTYDRKRDFKKTAEPPGGKPGKPPTGSRRFVIQRHRATRLHYDFRLEIDGVLASWAVPKGPSLDPSQKRMAVHVEDHPLEYFDFEGTIPKGEYGGGDVIVWDWGTWEPEETDDPGKALKKGELKFVLHGEKLMGGFVLIRTSGRPGWTSDKEQWLLIKHRDETVVEAWDVDDHPRSVKTGRTNDEVLAGAAAVWDSSAPAAEASIDLAAAREAPMPDFIDPMTATLADRPFDDEDWLFELKLDGYRIEAVVEKGRVRLWTRNKQDGARYFPDLAAAKPTWIRADTAIVDGEVVALNEEGEPDFSRLQDRAGMGRFGASGSGLRSDRKRDPAAAMAPITYFVFDLLYLDGRLLLDVPLQDRKKLLKSVLREHHIVAYSSHIDTDGEAFHDVARQRGLEGIMAKERHSRYEPGRRTKAWLKLKIRKEQELVVGGYELGKGSARDLGSLVVGVYEDGALHYAGHVGSGIGLKTRRELLEKLDKLRIADAPFVDAPRIKGVHWAKPEIVIRAEFAEWTTDKLVRQAAFKGFEIAKDPKKVVREVPVSATAAAKTAEREAKAKPGSKATAPAKSAPAKWAPAKSAPATSTQAKSTARTPKVASPRSSATKRPKSTVAAAAEVELFEDPQHRTTPPQAATEAEMAELEAAPSQKTPVPWSVGGHEIPLTNLDKVLFGESGFTKRDLIRYYVTIAPVLLPHLRGRALNLDRWPDGINGPHFWQKEIPKYAPDWMARWSYPDASSTEAHTYIVADRVATLAWLANHAAMDLHPWTSTTKGYRRPTYALIDIDPGDKTSWDDVVAFAKLYRAAMGHLGVEGFPKVTGKRGLQIWVPVKPSYSYRQTSAWVEAVSRVVGQMMADKVSWIWEKAGRKGLARLDYTQNAVNKTLVAPYAVRPAPDAPVSAPISWDELDDPKLRANRWNITSVLDRVRERGDLFAGVLELQQELPDMG